MQSPRFPFPFELHSERLIICSPIPAYAEAVVEAVYETLPQLQQWLAWSIPPPTVESMRDTCRVFEEHFRDGKDFPLFLFEKSTGIFVGGSGFHRVDWAIPKFEIGYWARASMQGKGYILETVHTLTDYAFDHLKAKRLEIRVSTLNDASYQLAEKAGYILEGILRNNDRHPDGSLCDIKVYAKIADSIRRT